LELASAAYDPFDLEALITHLSEAIRGFTAAGEPCRAAMVCVLLGHVMANVLGNLTAAKTWFARATHLVENQAPCVEQGWVAIAAMGCDVDDSTELLERAELALDRARLFGGLNLETKALADAGLAQVQLGRIEQGMAMLDEAMTLVCGPEDDGEARAKSVCSFFRACYVAVDFAMADSWSGLLRQWLTAAPHSEVAFGALGCDVSLNDLCDRPPRILQEGEAIDTGAKHLRQISTPHVPHGWEAQVLFEETTRTLLCGDLFSQVGAPPAVAPAT